MVAEPAFTVGIEEEYLLVDRGTRDLVGDPPITLLEECQALLEGRASPEFLRCQIEVGTNVCETMAEARADLARLRTTVAEVAARHGLALIAASTHPFATWDAQRQTDKARYHEIARDIQAPARRLTICGMHVHVGIADPDLRIDLMSQAAYFLPHLLALSTSSPFWRGLDTGLRSYRIAVFDELPRTGLPEQFDSYGEFERHLRVLVEAGIIEDGSRLWWDIRPSVRFPTLEMRISDVCTRLDDGIAIAALYRCILRMLWRLRRHNQRWRRYAAMLINENRWRAQRYGIDAGLIDFGRGELVPYPELLEELIALVSEDAACFGCAAEIAKARDILARGTSAHRQLALHRARIEAGDAPRQALEAVVDWLAEETLTGIKD
ncbi:MAG: putative glutamate--cysteine ligase 2 [Alphaproteobacteria bacterium]|nr:MAG: putative glutamate--cysteine ligase 2 [Alphaproteobacteria bacterium]